MTGFQGRTLYDSSGTELGTTANPVNSTPVNSGGTELGTTANPVVTVLGSDPATVLTVNKFGFASGNIGTSAEDLWSEGGTYAGYLTAATTVRIKAGGNGNDTAAGSGAREVTVYGLDSNGALANEAIATAGASASSATTTSFLRIFRAIVTESGSYGASAAAAITIENSGGGTDLAVIPSGSNQSQMALYSVPTGYTFAMRYLTLSTDDNNMTFKLLVRNDLDNTADTFRPWREIRRFVVSSDTVAINFSPAVRIAALSDIRITVTAASGTTNSASASFDGELVAV